MVWLAWLLYTDNWIKFWQLMMFIRLKLLRRSYAENYEYSMLSLVRYSRFVEILSCPTYREKSSRLRHRGFHNRYHWWCNRRFHNKWWCNKRVKQFVRSRFQLQIDQVILCLKSSVNQQRLLADKKLEGTCSGVYFKRFKSFMPIHIGKRAPD